MAQWAQNNQPIAAHCLPTSESSSDLGAVASELRQIYGRYLAERSARSFVVGGHFGHGKVGLSATIVGDDFTRCAARARKGLRLVGDDELRPPPPSTARPFFVGGSLDAPGMPGGVPHQRLHGGDIGHDGRGGGMTGDERIGDNQPAIPLRVARSDPGFLGAEGRHGRGEPSTGVGLGGAVSCVKIDPIAIRDEDATQIPYLALMHSKTSCARERERGGSFSPILINNPIEPDS